jgi:hypothetical protein
LNHYDKNVCNEANTYQGKLRVKKEKSAERFSGERSDARLGLNIFTVILQE